MGTNGYVGQIIGPFSANQELFDVIKKDANKEIKYVFKIGIQTDIRNSVFLNGVEFEIGKTGIFEARDVAITSIYFKQNVGKNTIIDYIIN